MEFKVGDRVRIKRNCENNCGLPQSHEGITGVIIRIAYESVSIRYDGFSLDDTWGLWHHKKECLELLHEGFDPKSLISKVFGVQ